MNALVPILPAVQIGAMALMALLAAYFHVNPSRTYNEPQE